MKPLISVIIPVYNVEKYLCQCVDSIINQSYKNLEIILIDDGSTDSSGNICDEYLLKDQRIKVIHQKNEGVSSARNRGVIHATGEYLSFIDSDDFINLNFYNKLFEGFKNENVDIAACRYIRFVDDKEIKEINKKKESEVWNQIEVLHEFTRTGDTNRSEFVSILCNKLFKTDYFKKIKFPEGKIHEDEYGISYILKQIHNMYICNEVLYYYRQRFESITGELNREKISHLDVIDAFELRCKIYKEEKYTEIYPEFVYSLLSTIIYMYYCTAKSVNKNRIFKKKVIKRYRKNFVYYRKHIGYPQIKYYFVFAISPKLFSLKYGYK